MKNDRVLALTGATALVGAPLTPRRDRTVLVSQGRVGAAGPGRAADLLAVRGDPLTDLGALRRVALVLRDGRAVVDRTREKAS
ncbi:hypothetical protein HFP72_29195 [Nocardiopsis sp. ARC36]